MAVKTSWAELKKLLPCPVTGRALFSRVIQHECEASLAETLLTLAPPLSFYLLVPTLWKMSVEKWSVRITNDDMFAAIIVSLGLSVPNCRALE